MSIARLRVTAVGPIVSFQDGGRFGRMRYGVPASGPMDRLAHAAANTVIGNDRAATAIEVSIGGLSVECTEGSVTVSIVGGDFALSHRVGAHRVGAHRVGSNRSNPTESWTVLNSSTVLTLGPGDQLSIRAGSSGSWTYLGVAGHLEVPTWLGHTATHSISGLGGGQLHDDQQIVIANARVEADRVGDIPLLPAPGSPGRARVALGPQDHQFDPAALSTLETSAYAFTTAYDRMGVRLAGPPLLIRGSLSIPSEPIVRGSIQVAGDGVPTLLFADHQTTGGYPKIATVISADLDSLTQLRPGDPVRFTVVSPAEAIAIARKQAAATEQYLAVLSRPGRTLGHRLMQEDLIGSHPFDDD